MNALRVGHFEEVKSGIHAVIGVGAGVSAVYNAAAFLERDDTEWHLLFNVGLYAVLTVFEAKRVSQHWRAR